MVKKMIAGFVFAILFISGAFAQEHGMLSVGIGGDFGFLFTSMNTNIPQPDKGYLEDELKNIRVFRSGFTAFIDTTLFEIDIGMKFYNMTYKQYGGNIYETDNYFNLGLFVKYPFTFTNKVTFFPLLGFDWQIFTRGKVLSGGQSVEIRRPDLEETNYVDRFAINVGVGLDYYIIPTIFIRGQLVYGINLNTKLQKDLIAQIKDAGYNLTVVQHSPSIRLLVGYNFN
jgi:hypothetical protein